tara:strand:+ start:568 stop:1287 length:720 start_codon:yes stop_codon:yes gene_type:complete
MVSKRNINRKKTVKKVIKVKPKLPEKPIVEDNPKEEFRKEIDDTQPPPTMTDIINAVTSKVVDTINPEINKKLESITTDIKTQITNEMKDIRSHLSQPTTSGNGDSNNEQQMSIPPIQNQQSLQGQPQNDPMDNPMVNIVLRLLESFLRPKPVQNNANEFRVFEQASIRKGMADLSMDDYLNQALRKYMAKKLLGESFDEVDYKKAEANADHYMKPMRDVAENARKAEELAKQNSEKHE